MHDALAHDTLLREGRRPLVPLRLKPEPWRRRLVARAEAEIDHAREDWARLVALHGLAGLFDERAPWQPHPSEPYRLAHEAWAACLLNIEGHLVGASLLLGRAIDVLKAQRIAARRSEQWSAQWAERARDTETDLAATLIPRRRALWHAFLDAAARYRTARAAVDAAALSKAA